MKSITLNKIDFLDSWFKKKCNGVWEHQYGVTIESTDNPGWRIIIDDAERNITTEKASFIENFFEHQVSIDVWDNNKVCIYAPKLNIVLNACVLLLKEM